MKGHDEDTLDRYEMMRFIGWCSLTPYMEKRVTQDKFWSIPERDVRENEEEKRSEAKKFMDEVTARYKEFYNR